MVLRFFPFAVIFLFVSCTDVERDDPDDPKSNNYRGGTSPSSSSSEAVVPLPSSSAAEQSSGSVAPIVPSSSSVPIQSGIIYGPSVTYEGETYQTVVIGTQTWFKRNLNYAVAGSRCYGDNTGGDSQNRCGTYGRLYDWATALTVCPSGWHLPSDAEWTTLTDYVGGAYTAGTKLKANSGLWNGNGEGTDTYGFTARPGGYGDSGGNFYNVGLGGYWWSTTEYSAYYAYTRYMYYNYESVSKYNYDKNNLQSVRCLED